jgi:hypothetical protein
LIKTAALIHCTIAGVYDGCRSKRAAHSAWLTGK